MYLHETPKNILEKLEKSLTEAKTGLEEWNQKVVVSQNYDLAKEFKKLIDKIEEFEKEIKEKLIP